MAGMCRDAADNKLNARASDLSSCQWSSKGFSDFFLQSLSLANLKGLGHLFTDLVRSHLDFCSPITTRWRNVACRFWQWDSDVSEHFGSIRQRV